MQKTRAFLFDMDGVLVNSEEVWEREGRPFEKSVFGKEILDQIGEITGTSLARLFEKATQLGFTGTWEDVIAKYDAFMVGIYNQCVITPGLPKLVEFLRDNNFHIGIVSSSRRPWIDQVLAKMPDKELFDFTLSLDEQKLPSKPDPAGYIEAMRELGVTPENTFILEDSNAGIKAAKESGAFTIVFTPLAVPGYQQRDGDAKAASFEEVMDIVKQKIG